MKAIYKKIVLSLIVLGFTVNASALDKGELIHKLIVGYNFGATAPMPLPREVRSVLAYWPQFTPQIGYNLSYGLSDKWSIETGVLLDMKGMGVQDKVKYMYTDVIMNDNTIRGYFTGKNETTVKQTYLTVPIRFAYELSDRWRIRAGGYCSYRSNSEFSGTVWDGYLRQTDYKDIINSMRINIPNKNEAAFDFGKEMRDYDAGISLGFEHNLNYRWGIYGDLTYSFTPVFPSSFKGIDMKMRNMYLAIGVSYNITSGVKSLTGFGKK